MKMVIYVSMQKSRFFCVILPTFLTTCNKYDFMDISKVVVLDSLIFQRPFYKCTKIACSGNNRISTPDYKYDQGYYLMITLNCAAIIPCWFLQTKPGVAVSSVEISII